MAKPSLSHSQNPTHLVWLDLEMTGLNPDEHTILEIATVVTNSQLEILAEGPSLAIHQDVGTLNRTEKWSRKTHTRSGLMKRVEESSVSMGQAEAETLAFIRQYCPPKVSPLCGNSIGHDRRFLVKYMPELFEYFHYRNIDVSTLKELVLRWYPKGPKLPKKQGVHLASEDIHESIQELVFYRKHYFISELPAAAKGTKVVIS